MNIPKELEAKVGTVNDAIKPISWLIGRWRSESAVGSFPTIKEFEYGEEIEFSSFGQPLLNYRAYSFKPGPNAPMHFEAGFLRIKPETKSVAFMVAHNFGVSTIEEGEVTGTEVSLESKNVGRMSFAKDPAVTKTTRTFKLNGDVLEQTMYMQTAQTPLTQHLVAKYRKVN